MRSKNKNGPFEAQPESTTEVQKNLVDQKSATMARISEDSINTLSPFI